MRDHTRAGRGRLRQLGGPAKLWLILVRLFGGRPLLSAEAMDGRMRRDIGLPPDGPMGVSDVRAAFDRKLLERGQPLP